MSELLTWATAAASNNSAPPDGFPENQFPSTVNNSAREVMAALARFSDMLGLPFINAGFTAAVASNDLTVTLKNVAGNNPSSTDPVCIFFRSTTITTGQRVAVNYTASTSVVLPGGGSLGFANSETGYIYIWAVYDGTNKDIGVSRQAHFDESDVHATTTIGTGSDAVNIIYTTTGRTGAAITLLGRIYIQYGTAAWTNAPSNLTVWQPGMSKQLFWYAAQATTSGSSWNFAGIPAWVKQLEVVFDGVSLSGTDNLLIQLGDAGGVETSGYLSSSSTIQDAGNPAVATSTAGFIIRTAAAADTINGSYTISLGDPTTNTWSGHGGFFRNGTPRDVTGGGSKSLSAILTQITITVTGSDTGDAGKVGLICR